MNDKIDIVIPWVDGNDPEWLSEKENFFENRNVDKKSNSSVRYESWDNFHLLLRAVDKCMPWVNNVFLITYGHLPKKININCPKLKIVKHSDFIPMEYLPTFNINTIEMNLYRIKELSENFIYFNDDMIPLQLVKETYYFKNNKVCDEAVEGHIIPVGKHDFSAGMCYLTANNMLIINKHFNKRDVQKKNFFKWFYPGYGKLLMRNFSLHYWYDFAGFHNPHMPSAMKKSVLQKIWNEEYELLNKASTNKFRAYNDVSQYLIRYWQLCSGEFYPRRTKGKYYNVTINNYKKIAEDILNRRYQFVCLNEQCTPEEFELIKEEINIALQKIYPDKSSFEQ